MHSESSVTGISIPPRPGRPPAVGRESGKARGDPPGITRAGTMWAVTLGALLTLSLLIVFILQNQDLVRVQYLGLSGSLPLGVGLVIAALTGGLMVAVVGAVRIAQLRRAGSQGHPRTTVPAPRRRSLSLLLNHGQHHT